MLKIAFVADIHIGNHLRFGGAVKNGINRRAELTLETLTRLVSYCEGNAITDVFVCGDVFDTAKPSPQMLHRTMAVLSATHVHFYLLSGNHDCSSDAENDNSLAPLRWVKNVTVIDQPRVQRLADPVTGRLTQVVCMPYLTGQTSELLPEHLERLRKQFAHPANGHNILALHAGIKDQCTPPWLVQAHDAIDADVLLDLMQKANLQLAFAGNWHNHQSWLANNACIIQCGALVPTGFDNEGRDYGYVHSVRIRDSSRTLESVHIVTPNFIKIDLDHFEKWRDSWNTYCESKEYIFFEAHGTIAQINDARKYTMLEQFGGVSFIEKPTVKTIEPIAQTTSAVQAITSYNEVHTTLTDTQRTAVIAQALKYYSGA